MRFHVILAGMTTAEFRTDIPMRRAVIHAIVLEQNRQPEPPMQMMIHNIREHDVRMTALPEKYERRQGREKPRGIDRHRFRK